MATVMLRSRGDKASASGSGEDRSFAPLRMTGFRTCVACGAKQPKRQLLRLVLRDGAVARDERQRLPGRGAYVCPTEFDRVQPKRLRRAFRATGEK